jgi:Tfp pilus assembly protein PilF
LFKHDVAVTENNITACFGLGKNCADQGRMEEAIWYLEQALRIKPEFPDVEGQLAHILAGQGKFAEAIERYRRALSQNPKLAEALNNLAWLLATHPNPEYRDGPEAVRLAERACETTKYQRAIYVGTLAAAYAEAGRFEDAIRTGERARQLALRWGETSLAARNLELIELYRSGKPFRETYK